MKSILFVTHDTSRTGAPILLLNLMNLLRQSGFSINCIMKSADGPLTDKFKSASNKWCVYYLSKKGTLIVRIIRKFVSLMGRSKLDTCLASSEIVILNTITNGDIVHELRRRYKGVILTYVHELEVGASVFSSKLNIDNLIDTSDGFIVPCNAVANFLIRQYEVLPSAIYKLDYFIPLNHSGSTRSEARVLKDNLVVGGCGTGDWRKGIDLFLLVALRTRVYYPHHRISFQWKGIVKNSPEWIKISYDINKAGLSDFMTLLESDDKTLDFFEGIDVLLLTSREDPYPLVVLEAGSLGRPTICFEQSGGAKEFVGSDAGFSVQYLDTNAMCTGIVHYYDDRNLLYNHGSMARQRAERLHLDNQRILEEFNLILVESLAKKRLPL